MQGFISVQSGGGNPSRSACQALRRLRFSQLSEELTGSQPKNRMPPSRRDLGERLQDKTALVQSRVGQNQLGPCYLLALVIEQIEIEHTRRIAGAASAPEPRFNPLHQGKQAARIEVRRHRYYSVGKPGLFGFRHGGAAVPARAPEDRDAFGF